ncbi:MAG: hypothetical protein DRR19_17035 [Candidatus Parabeggiatoa sp. nov. 1]|nr:MAG: hypothetical protein DRR19_17035 [Gammaproteobacteria bacterium]
MRLLKSQMGAAELTQAIWNEVALRLQQNKGQLGDLGGGNHFLDALLPYDEDTLYFLVQIINMGCWLMPNVAKA